VAVERILAGEDQRALLSLVGEICARELAPRVAQHEREAVFPRDVLRTLGRAGLLSLPYPADIGGGGQSYETYLQVLEELASAWASVAVGVSVHSLACYPTFTFGSEAQKAQWLPDFLGGDLLGAYCLSESHAGSDAAAMTATARRREGGGFMLNGVKAWVTHASEADFYNVFARLVDDDAGISCFLVWAGASGLSFGPPEDKMGLTGSTTASVILDDVEVGEDSLIGQPGQGLTIAYSALDSGRLGIAACAVGLAQSALDNAVDYAIQRLQFGRPIIEHQGLAFLLAEMAAAVDSARATTLDAARRRDIGMPFSRQASVAKLIATDAAMRVTTDAVQVFGANGYMKDYPVERLMREAKVMQIFEGTNQIQRLVISRHLARDRAALR
jgi:alkylation response protein AidB-like acyl-CoA dehydrogenase